MKQMKLLCHALFFWHNNVLNVLMTYFRQMEV